MELKEFLNDQFLGGSFKRFTQHLHAFIIKFNISVVHPLVDHLLVVSAGTVFIVQNLVQTSFGTMRRHSTSKLSQIAAAARLAAIQTAKTGDQLLNPAFSFRLVHRYPTCCLSLSLHPFSHASNHRIATISPPHHHLDLPLQSVALCSPCPSHHLAPLHLFPPATLLLSPPAHRACHALPLPHHGTGKHHRMEGL